MIKSKTTKLFFTFFIMAIFLYFKGGFDGNGRFEFNYFIEISKNNREAFSNFFLFLSKVISKHQKIEQKRSD
jgi:hypothetical protein